jgi:hypothetical protein
LKMTKYLSLVQQNINAISQLNKENEYRSVWTECIGLINESFFCKICKCRSYNFVDEKVIWQASMGDVLDASFKTLFSKIAAELFDKTHGGFELWC